ncbi:glycosyltransferase [Propioniciclava sinopodophylli]|uniref:Glycosyltransferase n=1 Tax=Propioniciclava sinopodophylli TaxID=1837344 RepID=A0A4Q9KE68_9ACTN|nr:glycosyltransferase [Propioniciclava sinopodophylli]
MIVAASPVLVPPAPDWPANAVQTGWWAPTASVFAPDPAFDDWLQGEPPVHVGYGSFTGFATDDDLEVIVRAAKASGRRVVTPTLRGHTPGQLNDQVCAIPPTPHAWLFPRMAGVVHHGGAGTTHAALAAGVPQAMVPFGVDQPYHAWRVHRLGLGPEPVSVHRLTVGRLGRLIRLLTTDADAAPRRSVRSSAARTASARPWPGCSDGAGSERASPTRRCDQTIVQVSGPAISRCRAASRSAGIETWLRASSSNTGRATSRKTPIGDADRSWVSVSWDSSNARVASLACASCTIRSDAATSETGLTARRPSAPRTTPSWPPANVIGSPCTSGITAGESTSLRPANASSLKIGQFW